jgi:hypothetical protein
MKSIEWPADLEEYAPIKKPSPKNQKAFVNFNKNSKSKIATLTSEQRELKQQRLDQYR